MNRLTLKKGTAIANTYIITNELARGGSSIAYEGYFLDDRNHKFSVILKEFYPVDIAISRDSENNLLVDPMVAEEFDRKKQLFLESFDTQHHVLEEIARNTTFQPQTIIAEHNTLYSVVFQKCGITYDKKPKEGETLKDILEIALSAATTIKKYHAAGYLYLDLKPSNLFVLHETNQLVLFFDFNSMVKKDQLNHRDLRLLYSPSYSAPEYVTFWYTFGDISEKTDYYSIGRLVYDRIFADASWEKDHEINYVIDFFEYFTDKLAKSHIQLTPLQKECLYGFFQKTLAEDPKERYENIDNLIEALEQIIEPTHKMKVAHFIKADITKTCGVETDGKWIFNKSLVPEISVETTDNRRYTTTCNQFIFSDNRPRVCYFFDDSAIGKTIAIHHILYTWYLGEYPFIPILIRAAGYSTQTQEEQSHYIETECKKFLQATSFADEQKYLILLDGINEVSSKYQAALLQQVDSLLEDKNLSFLLVGRNKEDLTHLHHKSICYLQGQAIAPEKITQSFQEIMQEQNEPDEQIERYTAYLQKNLSTVVTTTFMLKLFVSAQNKEAITSRYDLLDAYFDGTANLLQGADIAYQMAKIDSLYLKKGNLPNETLPTAVFEVVDGNYIKVKHQIYRDFLAAKKIITAIESNQANTIWGDKRTPFTTEIYTFIAEYFDLKNISEDTLFQNKLIQLFQSVKTQNETITLHIIEILSLTLAKEELELLLKKLQVKDIHLSEQHIQDFPNAKKINYLGVSREKFRKQKRIFSLCMVALFILVATILYQWHTPTEIQRTSGVAEIINIGDTLVMEDVYLYDHKGTILTNMQTLDAKTYGFDAQLQMRFDAKSGAYTFAFLDIVDTPSDDNYIVLSKKWSLDNWFSTSYQTEHFATANSTSEIAVSIFNLLDQYQKDGKITFVLDLIAEESFAMTSHMDTYIKIYDSLGEEVICHKEITSMNHLGGDFQKRYAITLEPTKPLDASETYHVVVEDGMGYNTLTNRPSNFATDSFVSTNLNVNDSTLTNPYGVTTAILDTTLYETHSLTVQCYIQDQEIWDFSNDIIENIQTTGFHFTQVAMTEDADTDHTVYITFYGITSILEEPISVTFPSGLACTANGAKSLEVRVETDMTIKPYPENTTFVSNLSVDSISYDNTSTSPTLGGDVTVDGELNFMSALSGLETEWIQEEHIILNGFEGEVTVSLYDGIFYAPEDLHKKSVFLFIENIQGEVGDTLSITIKEGHFATLTDGKEIVLDEDITIELGVLEAKALENAETTLDIDTNFLHMEALQSPDQIQDGDTLEFRLSGTQEIASMHLSQDALVKHGFTCDYVVITEETEDACIIAFHNIQITDQAPSFYVSGGVALSKDWELSTAIGYTLFTDTITTS